MRFINLTGSDFYIMAHDGDHPSKKPVLIKRVWFDIKTYIYRRRKTHERYKIGSLKDNLSVNVIRKGTPYESIIFYTSLFNDLSMRKEFQNYDFDNTLLIVSKVLYNEALDRRYLCYPERELEPFTGIPKNVKVYDYLAR